MSEQDAPLAEKVIPLTEPPKEGESEKGPSKGALKKAAKEKEKAEKAAVRKAAEDAQKKESEANDISKNDYGELVLFGPTTSSIPTDGTVPWVELEDIPKIFESSSEAEESGGPQVVLTAAVKNARNQGAGLAFLVLQHGYETIQGVVAKSETLSKQMVKFAGSIPSQSIVQMQVVVKKPKDPVKSCSIEHLEVHIKKLFISSKADSQLPMQVEDAERPIPVEGQEEQAEDDGRPKVGLNTRLDNRVIDLTASPNRAIFRIKAGVKRLFSEFLEARDFIDISSPKLLGASSEGGANVFEVKYFESKAYLAQSPQLYKQMCIAAGFQKVFEIGPVFRAENSNTARHLTEFVGLDMEMEFHKDYHEVVSLLEELMLHIFNGLRQQYQKETALLRELYHVEEFKLPEAGKVPRLTFAEGIAMLRADGVEIDDFEDLSTPQEKRLGALVLKKYGSDFYVLDKFPLGIRPFYTMPSEYNPKDPNSGYSNSYDFFMRGQEIMSGAQRIHQTEFLVKRMREHITPVDPESPGLKDYVNAFRKGCREHAGGGIGLERIVMLWLGLTNIRTASLFPRDPGRLTP
ncbi:hypothetical protein LTR36_005562 [Oleoguttula mirabilis]|uniref:aspartate--tRNA ligase n=1 Tax=Oleoguttula mirabilis TaxID=1507867 RepID=A0AAV9JF77_9PEZI|nr:hypothetical protein LTR36_005562 [Oleoguttula mirabilis]